MGKIAFLFAGQGGQDGPTADVQPAIFNESIKHAMGLKIKPDCVAGFSLGEITALHFAGVLDGEQLVKVRANAMQECCDKASGTMVAVIRLSKTLDFKGAWPVNFNSPDQTVYSMTSELTDKFIEHVTSQGGRSIKLKVSGAFHCPLMEDASKKVTEFLQGVALSKHSVPVYSNMTARPYLGDFKNLIAKQVTNPVQWQQTIENMIADGVDTFVECGPGRVLSGLVKKISEGKDIKIQHAEDLL